MYLLFHFILLYMIWFSWFDWIEFIFPQSFPQCSPHFWRLLHIFLVLQDHFASGCWNLFNIFSYYSTIELYFGSILSTCQWTAYVQNQVLFIIFTFTCNIFRRFKHISSYLLKLTLNRCVYECVCMCIQLCLVLVRTVLIATCKILKWEIWI